MSTLSKSEWEAALARLGELAAADGQHVELLLLGGGAMVLAFNARSATRDVDVMILAPSERSKVRQLAEVVAAERGWHAGWLNERAQGIPGRANSREYTHRDPGFDRPFASHRTVTCNEVVRVA